jgi:deoxyribodipyrimidine photo-lyase
VANGFEAAQKKYSEVVFPNEVRLFELWKEGKTGFPVIDAAMRMLNRTGFMPRKLRYSVSEFLVKDMLVDWKLGEKYFASRLVDYDPALNNAGWQWAAGLSTDPRPYFMISNPFNQGLKFDKDAIFIKKYVPELESVPAKRIHNW